MLRIATARAADQEAVVALLAGQFAELEIPLDRPVLEAAVAGALDDPRRGAILLAWLELRPVGVAYLSYQWALEHGGLAAWLEELFVLPDQRAHGIGEKLLEAALAHAAAAGCAAVDLEVEDAHPRARSLYERQRFVRRHRERWVKLLGSRLY